MPDTIPNPPPGFDDLSIEERIQYLQALWDRIAASPEEVPVPDWHIEVIKERLAELENGMVESRPWEAVRKELEERLSRRGPQE